MPDSVFTQPTTRLEGLVVSYSKLAVELEAERDRYHRALLAVRRLIDPHNPCHDGMREALLDALGEPDQRWATEEAKKETARV